MSFVIYKFFVNRLNNQEFCDGLESIQTDNQADI